MQDTSSCPLTQGKTTLVVIYAAMLYVQGDRLPQYGWTQHNGVDFGVHDVRDDGYSIVTEFVKRNGGRHGGDWSAKIKARTQV